MVHAKKFFCNKTIVSLRNMVLNYHFGSKYTTEITGQKISKLRIFLPRFKHDIREKDQKNICPPSFEWIHKSENTNIAGESWEFPNKKNSWSGEFCITYRSVRRCINCSKSILLFTSIQCYKMSNTKNHVDVQLIELKRHCMFYIYGKSD